METGVLAKSAEREKDQASLMWLDKHCHMNQCHEQCTFQSQTSRAKASLVASFRVALALCGTLGCPLSYQLRVARGGHLVCEGAAQ